MKADLCTRPPKWTRAGSGAEGLDLNVSQGQAPSAGHLEVILTRSIT